MPAWVIRALTAARKVPWKKVIEAVVYLTTMGRKYWNRLTPEERKEVLDLMAKSRGKRGNLTKAEQGRLFDLFDKIRKDDEQGKRKKK